MVILTTSLVLFLDNDISQQFCNDTEYKYDKLGEAVFFISSSPPMSSKCNVLVNILSLNQLVVIIEEEVVKPAEGCSISYQLMSNINAFHPKRSLCQPQNRTNIYTKFIFVRTLNGNLLQDLTMSLINTQHVNFTLTGNIVEAFLCSYSKGEYCCCNLVIIASILVSPQLLTLKPLLPD